jgi:hypothetical protein
MMRDIIKSLRAGYREARAVYRRARWMRHLHDHIDSPF